MGLFNILADWFADLTPGTKLSRRAWLVITYTPKGGGESKDISDDISKYFLSLSYTDNLSGQVDDITLTLEDRGQLWMGDWFPEEGAILSLKIHTYNWANINAGELTFDLGKFEIDEIEIQGMPSTAQIKAVSVISAGTLRGEKKNRTWDKISIWKCADDICKENGVELYWDCEKNPNLDHVEQTDESDLNFLQKITKDAGFSLKVTPEKVIIFDDMKYEKQEPVLAFQRPGDAVKTGSLPAIFQFTGYHFKAKTRDIYWKCKVKYQKGKEKKLIEGEFAAPDRKEGKILYVDEQVETVAEAEELAKKKLREANKDEFTGGFSTIGNFQLVAGIVIKLDGYGKFDGNYLITKANHEIGGSYTTNIEVRRCLNGY